MSGTNKTNGVLIVTILNFGIFLGQIMFSAIGMNSNNTHIAILFLLANFLWLGYFSFKGFRLAREDSYSPAVAFTAFAWPSFLVAAFVALYLLKLFGVEVQ